jgi:prepilin signal peptidase PulO-like enzyme (type II secretory pathway)
MFAIGTAVGSFLNVILYRTLKGEQWMTGRSYCDHCHRPIPWYLNVPLLSYVVLQGRSRCCDQPLSLSHPVIEVLAGSLFMWWYWGFHLFFNLTQAPLQVLQPLFWLSVGVMLLVITVVDVRYLIIPDELTVTLTILTVVYRITLVSLGAMQFNDLVNTTLAAFGAVGFFGLLWLITRGRGLGFGDVKLVFALTLLMGWPKMLVGFFASFVIGAVVGVLLILSRRHQWKQPLPFGPFLILGTGVALTLGEQIWTWYSGLLGL